MSAKVSQPAVGMCRSVYVGRVMLCVCARAWVYLCVRVWFVFVYTRPCTVFISVVVSVRVCGRACG